MGRNVIVEDDVLLSNDVRIRNFDMHGIHDVQSREQLNHPCDTILERHVWLGQDALLLGSERIGFGSIVGARSIVKKTVPSETIVAGIPSRVIRRDASWSRSIHDFTEQETSLLDRLRSLSANDKSISG